MKLAVDQIHEDPTLQLRDGLDMDRVEAMIEFEEQGGQLPPITVVGDNNLLGDGHHRLYAAITSGKVELDANRIPGGMPEAVVVAITGNDIATHAPLDRPGRNKGVKLLLRAGWSQQDIEDATGIDRKTIGNIANSLAARGALPKALKASGGAQGRKPKPVATLPTVVADKLTDTHLVRIADGVPLAQQVEFATAVADAGLSEPRTREAIKELREGVTPREAVEAVAPIHRSRPASLAEVAKQARRRIEHFASDPMTVEGQERDFWEVMEVLAAQRDAIPLEVGSLSRLLAELSVKADLYATVLASDQLVIAR